MGFSWFFFTVLIKKIIQNHLSLIFKFIYFFLFFSVISSARYFFCESFFNLCMRLSNKNITYHLIFVYNRLYVSWYFRLSYLNCYESLLPVWCITNIRFFIFLNKNEILKLSFHRHLKSLLLLLKTTEKIEKRKVILVLSLDADDVDGSMLNLKLLSQCVKISIATFTRQILFPLIS